MQRISRASNNTDLSTPTTPNGHTNGHGDIIDDDIQHTVGRLFQQNNGSKGRHDGLEDVIQNALQAERNHWKQRLHLSMQEIDRQHKVALTVQTGLQDLVRILKHNFQRAVILEGEEDSAEDLDNLTIITKLLEILKFQVRQLKLRAGVPQPSKTEFEEAVSRQKMTISELKERIRNMKKDRENLEAEITQRNDKISSLQKENSSLHRQIHKLQKIIDKYNENHTGANFHLNNVNAPTSDKFSAMSSLEMSETSGMNTVRERTYIEGDQLVSYPTPSEENAIFKDRIKRNIYSVRKGDSRSSTVAQCLRCQTLFKPAENTYKSCKFHHKGREIREQFDSHGKLEKVLYKWACCKKPLETPGCCFGYHV